MTSARLLSHSHTRKLATMIDLGGWRFSPELLGCCRDTFRGLIAQYRLVAEHPWGRPTYWTLNPSGYSKERARWVLANLHRAPTSAEERLQRKLTRARKAGLIPEEAP